MSAIVAGPGLTGQDHAEGVERCRYCGRRHPAIRLHADVRWCDGLLAPCARWVIVELERELAAVAR